jgi:iron complex outermembrane receptor protein
LAAGDGAWAEASTPADLRDLSLEELAQIQVTSVSKRPETLGQTASAIYVISRDEVLRSGAQSLPEMLRLAPNLQVYQSSSSRYVVTARGHNGAQTAQNFSNKLLVMVDGRSVYTPLFSGVFWDMQGVVPDDIDRIEVISGPGAALWGANAVNGVISVITRDSAETQGISLTAIGGEWERGASARFGGLLSDDLTYRVYVRTFERDSTETPAGRGAHDHWSRPQAGFRLDWRMTGRDQFTLQGDAYDGFEAQAGAAAQNIQGANMLARWTRAWNERSNLQVQAYYDRAMRGDEVNGVGFRVETYDLYLQHTFAIGERHSVVWGGGYRASRTDVDNTSTLLFRPARRDLRLANVFAQDSIALGDRATLTLGLKYEDNPYLSPALLPNIRLAWKPRDGLTVWGAASKAIRSATPFDRDVVERVGGADFLVGDADFRSEKLTAYELGAKLQAGARASVSLNAFYNVYDDLRSIEFTPGRGLPLRWGNRLAGHTYGLEAWGDVQVADWWRVSGSVAYIDERFRFAPGATRLLGPKQVANDPKYDVQLKSLMTLRPGVAFGANLRYVSPLPEPRIPAYVELNSRLTWDVTPNVQLGVSGRNLLHRAHREYTEGNRIPRSISADVQWRF